MNTYAKLHNEGVNNTSNDRDEIKGIPRIFEKILQTDRYIRLNSKNTIQKCISKILYTI